LHLILIPSPMLKSASSALSTPMIRSTQYVKQARLRGKIEGVGGIREDITTLDEDERYNK